MNLHIAFLYFLWLTTSISLGDTEDKWSQNDQTESKIKQQDEQNTKFAEHARLNGFTLDDSNWKIVWHGSLDTELLDAPDMETILMLTKDNEQYNCRLETPKSLTKNADAYNGPSALELMEPLFNKGACSYRLESYWTYEVCHGEYVRQYHDAKEGKETKTLEFFLGRYSQETFMAQIAQSSAAAGEATAAKPKTLRLEEVDLPYLEVVYADGTVCDLTGQPRQTQVRYVCHASGRHELVSFQETSSCQYVIVVLSPLLCSHPDYKVEADLENSIHCIALSNSPKRPRSLLEMEAESLQLRHRLTIADPEKGTEAGVAERPAPAPAPAPAPPRNQSRSPPTSLRTSLRTSSRSPSRRRS